MVLTWKPKLGRYLPDSEPESNGHGRRSGKNVVGLGKGHEYGPCTTPALLVQGGVSYPLPNRPVPAVYPLVHQIDRDLLPKPLTGPALLPPTLNFL